MDSGQSILMRKALGPQDVLQLPESFVFVRFREEAHAKAACSLLNAAYANGGGTVETFEQWWPALKQDDEFDPELLFAVEQKQSGALAGFAQCWTSGFVKDIAVAEIYRRQGIAAALMSHMFEVFQARGMASVSLKVQANNRSGALELYRSLGMVAA